MEEVQNERVVEVGVEMMSGVYHNESCEDKVGGAEECPEGREQGGKKKSAAWRMSRGALNGGLLQNGGWTTWEGS